MVNLALAVLALVLTQLKPGAIYFSFTNHELSSRKSQAVEIEAEQALTRSHPLE